MSTHACPPVGSGLMPCCGRTPFEVPRSHRITVDTDLVTCGTSAEVRQLRARVATLEYGIRQLADVYAVGFTLVYPSTVATALRSLVDPEVTP